MGLFDKLRKNRSTNHVYDLTMQVIRGGDPITFSVKQGDMRLARELATWFDEPIGKVSECIHPHACMRHVLSPLLRDFLKMDELTIVSGMVLDQGLNHAKEHWEEAEANFNGTWRSFYNKLAWDAFTGVWAIAALILTDGDHQDGDEQRNALALGLVRAIKQKILFDLAQADPKGWHWLQDLDAEMMPERRLEEILKREDTALRGVAVVKRLKAATSF
jgi:hypothetical protein